MPKPVSFKRKVFASKNGFNPYAGGRTPKGAETRVRGYCLAMTCRWIKLSMQHGMEGSARVMDGRELLHISIAQAVYLKCFPITNSPANSTPEREKLVFDQAGLKIKFDKSVDDTLDMDNIFDSAIYFNVLLPRHSVGIYFNRAMEQVFYFDPNYGLYEYDMEDMEDCLNHWGNYVNTDEEEKSIRMVHCVGR